VSFGGPHPGRRERWATGCPGNSRACRGKGGASRAPGGRALLWVEDQGPGVPAGSEAHIFEPYYRLESHRESAVAGSGIGLAVVREIARGHGGDIRVERVNGRGARFVVTLPCLSNGAAPSGG